MASTYARPHLSFEAQLEGLKNRGLIVTDDAAALAYLRRLGYYRLSAYLYPFRQSSMSIVDGKVVLHLSDNFKDGASFHDAINLYVFDKKLRMLVSDAIERIEVAIRVDIAYNMGRLHTFAHHQPEFLHGHFSSKVKADTGLTKHQEWLNKLRGLTDKSKEDFVKHYRSKYGLPLPIWVSIEVWDFGLLSHFYAGMKLKEQEELANRFGIPSPNLMTSWLRAINYVRNIAAHHGRLFNRNMVDYPIIPQEGQIPAFDPSWAALNVYRPYATLCVISYLMKRICPGSSWQARVKNHLQTFPVTQIDGLSVKALGCDDSWANDSFW
ncbi:Abi family protein [Xanthomonas campestris]|uniref:Abi family protein n=1 Tax=Xanthomonas campestris TaxID=339 RepID=UPI002AD48B09|nr:Abi family protein [Xanthomonas campestris]MEA0681703.1 Abi family protein [Xanthomonas campestris pv. campestris]MEA0814370.1 Abi family protein [Xanthomonas campestris pv. campestris]MEB1326732.1 Abi family protein [Xanthomonas campestris pv. campestris]MEB1540478.1 Abi family protein [Xanthomonas campestris pv. campestris]MEB2197544.1 Abi family protein [Xanthomonas campestris pv. campestris]